MNETGFVMLGGVRFLITVRKTEKGKWISARAVGVTGERLTKIEAALKKRPGASKLLREGKVLAV